MQVVDEIHMMDDRDRGFLLELLLTKIRMKAGGPAAGSGAGAGSSSSGRPQPIQIIGMSATLPNVDEVAKWLVSVLLFFLLLFGCLRAWV